MAADDWDLPESWLCEDTAERRIAIGLRREQWQYAEQIIRLQNAGGPQAEIDALELSKWHCIQQASKIERHLRGM